MYTNKNCWPLSHMYNIPAALVLPIQSCSQGVLSTASSVFILQMGHLGFESINGNTLQGVCVLHGSLLVEVAFRHFA
jgi:hypothetical protein